MNDTLHSPYTDIFSGKILTVDNIATFLLYHTPTLVCPNECTIGFYAPHKQSVRLVGI